jgi:hypothetical protein
MKELVVAIVGTTIVALIVGFTNDWFGIGDPPKRAVVRIVSFDHYTGRNHVGDQPFAQGELRNGGNAPAVDCIVHWQPGLVERSASGALVLLEERIGVAVIPPVREGKTSGFFSAPAFRFTEPGPITTRAWVTCANTEPSATVVFTANVVG